MAEESIYNQKSPNSVFLCLLPCINRDAYHLTQPGMVDAEAAVAAAQALANQFAEQADQAQPAVTVAAADNGEPSSNKRKPEGEVEGAEALMRKRASFNGPSEGAQVDLLAIVDKQAHACYQLGLSAFRFWRKLQAARSN